MLYVCGVFVGVLGVCEFVIFVFMCVCLVFFELIFYTACPITQ